MPAADALPIFGAYSTYRRPLNGVGVGVGCPAYATEGGVEAALPHAASTRPAAAASKAHRMRINASPRSAPAKCRPGADRSRTARVAKDFRTARRRSYPASRLGWGRARPTERPRFR